MKFLIALFTSLGLITSVYAADAKKEEPKKDAPKAEVKKDEPVKPKVKPVGKDGKPVDAPKADAKKEAPKAEAKK